MLKMLETLVRGAAADVGEAVFDANAARILGQQLREAAAAVELSKKELACAMGYHASEKRAVQSLDDRIAGLESNAVAAIAGAREDLAAEAAVVIAAAEDERGTRTEAMAKFQADVDRLMQLVEHSRNRLNALRRGLEMARVQAALQRAGMNGRRAIIMGAGALRDAEATLQHIRQRQARDQDIAAARDAIECKSPGHTIDGRLAAAGFATCQQSSIAGVLARLKLKAAAVGSALAADNPSPTLHP